jgi:diguanylate cyclase (GGDEF)-like protein
MNKDRATLLIIDDQPSSLHALAQTLKQEYTLLIASNGHDALDVARNRQPDLILLDVVMPDMSGLEVCRTLKSDPELCDIPVIFVTAKDEAEDEAAGLDIGAIDYIGKPFNPPIVRARVRNHLELKQQRDLLRRIAMMDGLTGVANRRTFDHTFEREWRRSQRTEHPLSLVLVDVDHFKAYNDTYGHQDGDDCLRAVAQCLESVLQRPADLIARYGGEEFACLLPETDLAGACEIAERLRHAVESLAIVHKGSTTAPMVTISLGVSNNAAPKDSHSADAALRHADALLYQAKNAGRNRVVCGALEAQQ